MPFTGSHPAVILPFGRTRLLTCGLVFGSVVPDAGFFAPVPIRLRLGHSAEGVVGADALLSLLVFVVWHGLGLVPVLHDQLGPLPGYRWAQYVSSVVGALIVAGWLLRWWRGTPTAPAPGAGSART